MTYRRIAWAVLSPFVWVMNRAGFCSYAWVNVCHGARHSHRFDQLWQHRWYGAPLHALPRDVTLCGIGYVTAVAEGTVTFVDADTRARITFDRDDVERHDMWTLLLAGTDVVPAAHVRQAYEWVCAVFGDSHEWRRSAVSSHE
jgi:hypothetical protein